VGNRNKTLRKIIVNGIEYIWSVNGYNCDGDGGCRFIIWENKVEIHHELIHNEKITPKIVREKILELKSV